MNLRIKILIEVKYLYNLRIHFLLTIQNAFLISILRVTFPPKVCVVHIDGLRGKVNEVRYMSIMKETLFRRIMFIYVSF